MKRMGLLFILSLVLVFPLSQASALDTDLYAVTSADVPPNVMIMFDNSISMNELVSGVLYDPNTTYPFVVTDAPNKVYYRTGGGSWNLYRDSIDGVTDGVICATVQTALKDYGFYTGKIRFLTSECGTTNNVNLNTGNYLNYMQLTGGPADKPKLGLAKGIIQSYINTTEGVRFGAMVFNYNEGGHLLKEIKDMTPLNRADLHAAIGGLAGDTYTPLAETLYETGLYFKGAQSYFNKDASGNPIQYTSPVQVWCQKNYVIIITDGESTKDRNVVLKTISPLGDGDVDGDKREPGLANEVPYDTEGSDYLDDVAKICQDTDFDPVMKEKQHITTYTVGFTFSSPLLERTAQHGKGRYFYCHNAQSFIIAMQKIIDEILAKSTSYVAPVVPISQMEKTSAGDRMYIAMFKPTMKSFWEGNIKKYGIATEKNGSIEVGDILDKTGALAMDSSNKIREDAISYWSSESDGENVKRGGVGEVLQNRTTPRNIYTYLGGSDKNLYSSPNAFNLSNSGIFPSTLGVGNTTQRDAIINFIHGLDAYDENGNGIINEKRDWILGSFIHSRPVVIHYGETDSVIYAGANDGMLHAFDDDSGEELWAFIPPSLLPCLKNLSGDSIEFFVDGAPKVHFGTDKTVLIFGLRRGGDRYYALDITERLSPKFLWEIGPSTNGFIELGQTWSTPQMGKIQLGAEEKWVAFIGGGYDTNQDKLPASANDARGRAVYVVDILTGERIWSYSNQENPDADMTYCIPSDVARVDTDGNGKIDRLYVGDVGGRIWRFDIGDLNKDGNSEPSEWTGRIIFSSNAGTSDQRKIFNPPDVTLEKDSGNYEMLFFGTGDREHPKATDFINRLYAVKDKNLSAILTETHLVDVTADRLQDSSTTPEQKITLLKELSQKNGWFIKLDNPGEKCLSVPVVFYGIAYYTTFSPTLGGETDICFVGEGEGRLYALSYKTGNAVFNLDGLGTMDNLTRDDRSITIGATIPSGVIITFIRGTSVGYVGVGGGVYRPRLFSGRSIIPVTWRIVF